MKADMPAVRVIAWLLVMLGCVLLLVSKARILSDMGLFLPSAVTPRDELLVNELREGPAARFILMAIEGGTLEQRAASSRRLAQMLRSADSFARVVNGERTISRNEEQILFRYRYLIGPSPVATDFGADTLRNAFAARLQELRSPLSVMYKQLLPVDPTGVMLAMAERFQGQAQPSRMLGVWFSDDGQRALLLAETKARGFDLDSQEEALRLVRDGFAPIAESQGTRLVLSGPGVYGVLSRTIIRNESSLLSFVAMGMVFLVMLAGYRSWSLLLAAAIPIGTAVVAGTGAVALWYGEIHGITLAFGITLLGISIDYPIHLFSHLEGRTSPDRSLAEIWPTMRLGVLTTCLGFLAMMTAGFSGLTQLALFAITGLLAAALSTRWILPSLLSIAGLPAIRVEWAERLVGWIRPGRLTRLAVLFLVLIGIVFLAVQNRSPWEDDLAALSPVPRELIALDRSLRAELRAPEVSHLIVIRGGSDEEVLQLTEKLAPFLRQLAERKALAGYELPSRYLPSRQLQAVRQNALPERRTLERNIKEALAGMVFDPDYFMAFVNDVEQSRDLEPLALADLEGSALGLRLASQLLHTGKGWLAMVPLAGVEDQDAIAAAVTEAVGSAGFALNLKEETNRLIGGFRRGAFNRLAIGIAFIMLALVVGLRSFRKALQVMVPVLFALTLALALLLWTGERLTLFHLVSLLLVLGITLDYSLFFNRQGDSPEFRVRTLHALTICALSTASVFGILALSDIPVLNAIGKTVAFGVLTGYIVSLALARPAGGGF